MGEGGMMALQNVFDHCAHTLRRGKLKLGDLILIYGASENISFGFLDYPVLP